MGWRCIECDNVAEKWGLCKRCWDYWRHPSNNGKVETNETSTIRDTKKPEA